MRCGREATGRRAWSDGTPDSGDAARNDGNAGEKTFRIANGAFYPSFLWLGNRPVQNNGVTQYEPAYGPGCELASPAEIAYGMVRCPLAGVTEVVIEMGPRTSDGLTLLAGGTGAGKVEGSATITRDLAIKVSR